jgi:hypothetical protein
MSFGLVGACAVACMAKLVARIASVASHINEPFKHLVTEFVPLAQDLMGDYCSVWWLNVENRPALLSGPEGRCQ